MSVSLYSFMPKDGFECFYCLGNEKTEALAHKGTPPQDEHLHAAHKTCYQPWLLKQPICPLCRTPIENARAFFPQKQIKPLNSATALGASSATFYFALKECFDARYVTVAFAISALCTLYWANSSCKSRTEIAILTGAFTYAAIVLTDMYAISQMDWVIAKHSKH